MASNRSRRVEVPVGYTIVRDGGWCRVRRDADSALAGQRWPAAACLCVTGRMRRLLPAGSRSWPMGTRGQRPGWRGSRRQRLPPIRAEGDAVLYPRLAEHIG